MNWSKIYNDIIIRGKNREKIDGLYYETHHILPKCMGGDDSSHNLVDLFPREHFLAHGLLVKIYHKTEYVYALASAFNMMCVGHNGFRNNNRSFGLARTMFSKFHPAKTLEVSMKISKGTMSAKASKLGISFDKYLLDYKGFSCFEDYYFTRLSNQQKEKQPKTKKVPEQKICGCGCGETTPLSPNGNRRYLYVPGHKVKRNNPSDTARVNMSNSAKNILSRLTEQEMKDRMYHSTKSVDHVARGKSISKGKKGKSTNQIKLEEIRYGQMTDIEFDSYTEHRKPYIKARMLKRRLTYLNGNNS